jgi:L-2-hydroxyglutarate oxidase LhgO
MATATPTNQPDVVLVGAGVMSATLAVFLKELDPSLKIEIHEVLGSAAQESSNAWNNAGTGHAALCELNYTPQKADGSSGPRQREHGKIASHARFTRTTTLLPSTRYVFPETSGSEPGSEMS